MPRSSGTPPVLFTCPTTRFQVQHWLLDDDEASEQHEAIICEGCVKIHFVNRMGKVLGAVGDD
jgi:hypothetical protein